MSADRENLMKTAMSVSQDQQVSQQVNPEEAKKSMKSVRSSKVAKQPSARPVPKSPRGQHVQSWRDWLGATLRIENEYIRLALAECIGTFILVTVGNGSIAQDRLSGGKGGSMTTVALGWGLAAAMAVYVCGGVSGGHINPAVTTAMVVLGRLPMIKLPVYFVGQYLGAMVGSVAVYVVYFDSLNKLNATSIGVAPLELAEFKAGIWATYPKDYVDTSQCFADQVLATGLLMIVVMGITDERNMATLKGLLCSYAHNCGAALNPARDLAPRIFTTMAGWKGVPFSKRGGNWFWVPIMGPHIGAILGAWCYNVFIGLHWPDLPKGREQALAPCDEWGRAGWSIRCTTCSGLGVCPIP